MWSGRWVNIISPVVPTTSGICDLTYDQMVNYVDTHCTPSGATISGVTYEDMVNYVVEHCTVSGLSYDEMVTYVTDRLSTISGTIYLSDATLIDGLTLDDDVVLIDGGEL
jgi:hypothetical protein